LQNHGTNVYNFATIMQSLLAQLTPQTIILTPNLRLSSYLREQIETHYLTLTKQQSWPTPKILPFNIWLAQFFAEFINTPLLLNNQQEQALWQLVINETYPTATSSLIKMAKNAYDLLQQWQIPLASFATTAANQYATDITIFNEWAQEMQRQLNLNHWCITSNIPNLLSELIKNNSTSNAEPKLHLLLIGFEELTLTPQIKDLLQTLAEHGHTIINFDINTITNNQQQRLSFAKQTDEIFTMARWAKYIHEQNPQTSIGCIVPNLPTLRNTIERIFIEVFKPTALLASNYSLKEVPFNISAGKKPNEYAIINAALKILALNTQLTAINIADLACLLNSPYLSGGNTEMATRSNLNLKLQTLPETNIPSNELIAEAINDHCPIFAESFKKFIEIQNKQNSAHTKLSLKNWMSIFTTQLQSFAWPGERNLDSVEYQAVKSFHQSCDELLTLELINKKWGLTEALQALYSLTAQTIFQPEQSENTHINILGTLEAAGMNFDYLWIMGLDDETWPPPSNPNPFIPIGLQKKLNMPNASAERQLQFSQAITKRLMHSAQNIVCSYTKNIDDNALNPSPLILAIPEITATDLKLANFIDYQLITQQQSNDALEIYTENFQVPLSETENISRGSNILKLQATCPFQAFSKIRLKAEPLTLPTNQFALLRGSLVHKALEIFWQQIKNHKNLCAYNQDNLEKIIDACIAESIKRCRANPQYKITDNFAKLESRSLKNLLCRWIEFEKNRTPFAVIALEKTIAANLGKLTFKLRIDRIDRLADDSLIIIDYKTGKNKPQPQAWDSERPDDPQLPLYCITATDLDAPINGTMFAHIHLEENKPFSGRKNTTIPVINEIAETHKKLNADIEDYNANSWQQLMTEWRHNLENLAVSFYRGEADIDPKNPTENCKQCGLISLCRNGNLTI
jgi:ATP-dependent helicase/nuclease subunit B